MNKVIISGRLANDTELKYSTTGTAILRNSLAVKRDRKNEKGEYPVDFINIVLFGSSAKFIADYANKGDLIGVEGKIRTRTYENQKGQKVYSTEVVADNVEIFAAKKKEVIREPIPRSSYDPYAEVGNEIANSIEDPFLDNVSIDDIILD